MVQIQVLILKKKKKPFNKIIHLKIRDRQLLPGLKDTLYKTSFDETKMVQVKNGKYWFWQNKLSEEKSISREMLEISNRCSSTFNIKNLKISILVYLVFVSVQSHAQNQNKDRYCPQINPQELLDGYSRGQKVAVHFW